MSRKRPPVSATLVASCGALVVLATLVPTGVAAGNASGGLPAGADVSTVGSGAQQATITRNSYGVPTVDSSTLSGMWFGAGYAQAQDRMAQLELTRRTVEGTLSQIGGPSYLSQDETVRTFFYTPAELRAQFARLPAVRPTCRRGLLRRHQRLRGKRLRADSEREEPGSL